MSRALRVGVPLLLIAGGVAWWIAVTPDHPLLRLWRAKQHDLNAKVIVGPYPIDADFATLRKRNVTLIVSLLNPALPYENVLLEKERVNAAKAGIELKNFPMTSIVGYEIGADLERNETAAAEAAQQATGKVYLHCYLGIHRARRVADKIAGATATYQPRQVERSEDRRLLDEADAAYAKGDYAATLQLLAKIRTPDAATHALRGWASYKSGRIDDANVAFRAASFASPTDAAPLIGLGYVALRRNALGEAQESFRRALVLRANDVDALTGAGIVAYRQGRAQDAVALLRRAVALDPRNEEAAELLRKSEATR
jgi:Flp pilus assembly protein TadD